MPSANDAKKAVFNKNFIVEECQYCYYFFFRIRRLERNCREIFWYILEAFVDPGGDADSDYKLNVAKEQARRKSLLLLCFSNRRKKVRAMCE